VFPFSPLHLLGKNVEKGKSNEIEGKKGSKEKKKRCGEVPCERQKDWTINCNCKDFKTSK